MIVRDARQEDHAEILAITRVAFPEEDLVPLMSALLLHETVRTRVAQNDGSIFGFICWSSCTVGDATETVALLGPLAVRPKMQRQGIGSELVKDGLAELAQKGVSCSVVLGDPAYYGRFGYAAETKIQAPYPLPEEWRTAWQGLKLKGPEQSGILDVPEPWRSPVLWLP